LKWIVLSATLLAAIVVTVQLYWLKKVYSFEQRQFNLNVVKSIRGLFEDLQMNDAPGTILQSLINAPKRPTTITVFKADTIPIKDSLAFYLQDEFADFGVLTDCKLARLQRHGKEIRIRGLYPRPRLPLCQRTTRHRGTARLYQQLRPYPAVLSRTGMNISSNKWTSGSSARSCSCIALIGLAASLFYFYRQKFLAEIQKDFVNNFTHEFKTPLAVMKIASDVLAQDSITRQPDRLERYAAIIQNQTEHLQQQVERLLRTASIETKDLPIRKEEIDAHQLIEEALSKVQPLIEQKNARVEVKMEEFNGRVQADKAHLELALVNLLENALKYSADPHIVVQAGHDEDDFFISVKTTA
jgi:two-component system phosphate regulon sensor histidine kinase PhoR